MSGVDPDGRWVHIAIGAAIGGIVNVATHWDDVQRDGLSAGLSAFGIGALAGGIGAATGGAAFAAAGGGAGGVGGFLAGAWSGASGGVVSASIQGPLNSVRFGDPFSIKDVATAGIVGGLTGGVINGTIAYFNKGSFLKGPMDLGKSSYRIDPGPNPKPGPRKPVIEVHPDLEFGGVLDYSYPNGTIGYTPQFAGQTASSTVGQVQSKIALYPQIIDPRTLRPILMPLARAKLPLNSRVQWNSNLRDKYIGDYMKKGYPEPKGGWDKYQINQILPREFGGTNDFNNLVPVLKEQHKLFNNFWRYFGEL